MALDSTKVRVAKTGALYVKSFATGDTPPTNGTAAIPAGFGDVGYIGDDGVTETRDRDKNTISAWQNGAQVRQVVTSGALSFQCVMIETNATTVGLYYGTTVDPTTGKVVIVPTKTGGLKSFYLDVIDDAQVIRTYIDQGEITDVGDMQFDAGGDPIGYDVTISCYPSSRTKDAAGSDGSAVKFYLGLIS